MDAHSVSVPNEQALRRILDPARGQQHSALIEEDLAHIQRNLHSNKLIQKQTARNTQRPKEEILTLRGHIQYEDISIHPREFFPNSRYWDLKSQQAVDITQKLINGETLSDTEIRQVKLDIDILKHTAKTKEQLLTGAYPVNNELE